MSEVVSWSSWFTFRGIATTVILVVLVSLLFVESYCSYRKEHPTKVVRRSYLNNLCVFVFDDTVMSLLSVSSLLAVADTYASMGFLGKVTSVPAFIIALVLFDLTLYLWHRVRHHYPWLWALHQIHHSDLVVNATTAFRLHFVEVFFTVIVKAIFIVVVGVSAELVLLNEIIVTVCALFHHTNITFRGEKLVGRIFVVPYFHRAHHSTRREEHDSNYGAVFSLWDTLFGTRVELEPVAVGIKDMEEQSFLEMLFISCKKKKKVM